MNRSLLSASRADRDRLNAIHALPCLACAQEMNEGKITSQPSKTEAHHLVDKGYREHSGGHQATIPLCGWHHRGECVLSFTTSQMTYIYGPSMAKSKPDFVERYGGERILLVETDALIASNKHLEAM